MDLKKQLESDMAQFKNFVSFWRQSMELLYFEFLSVQA